MTFANSSILVALAALAIPLAVHLLGWRKARRVLLPTARFAEGAHAATKGRARLRRLVLLGLRLAAVGLLVLGVAEPRFGDAGPAPRGGPWIVCLDTTPSMDAHEAGKSRQERARDAALRLLAEARADEPAVLAVTGLKAEPTTVGRLRERLAEPLPPDWTCEPLGGLIERAAAACPGARPALPHEDGEARHPSFGLPKGTRFVVATDAAPWAVRDINGGRFGRLGADVTLVPVGADVDNAWIDLPRAVVVEVDGERRLSVEAVVVSRSPRRGETVRCVLDGDDVVGQMSTRRGLGQARFLVPLRGYGPWRGHLALVEPDPLVADNVRYFVAEAPGTRRALVVDAAAGSEEGVASVAMVKAAFPENVPGSTIRTTLVSAATADAEALGAVDMVFWVGSAAPVAPPALERFVTGGGGLVWLPAGARPAPKSLAKLLGVAFEGVDRKADGVTMDPAGHGSPVLAAFEGGASGDVSRPVFTQRLRMRAQASAEETVRFLDGRAAIVPHRHGRGRTVALAVGPGRAWGNLGVRPEFVVLMHSVAGFVFPDGRSALVLGRDGVPQLPGSAGEPGYGRVPISRTRDSSRRTAVNLAAEETANLLPQVDRLQSAFDAERVRIMKPSQVRPAKGVARGAPSGLSGWLVAALFVALGAELALATRQAAGTGPRRRPPGT